MAIILPPDSRVLDADGDPVSGGKFRVYTANTTTLADLFSDAALATPRANPVVANAAGELPFFFIASGAYDIAVLDASDVELASAEDVPAWGEDTGDFSRTVSGLGRIKITGAAGAVYIQAGSPSPDNVGGDLTIEGWAGTQLDSLTLDAATTNTTGFLTENSKKLHGVVATPATTVTASATIDIALTESPDGVRAFRVDIFDLTHSANPITLGARFSYDNGATYKSGAADYSQYQLPHWDGTAAGAINQSAAATHISLQTPGDSAVANANSWLTLEILTPESGNGFTVMRGDYIGWEDGSPNAPTRAMTCGYGHGSYGRATHVRIYIVSGGGTLTGKYRMMPMRAFGE
jgi:hypothetical protein